jgi:predicted CXXCH cytochrome family protein
MLTISAVVVISSSCTASRRTLVLPREIPGATYVGNQACSVCHTNYVRAFPPSPHSALHVEHASVVGQSGCESCHGPGSLHAQAGRAGTQLIINPGKDPGACFECHLESRFEFSLPYHHHVPEGRMNCVQCHDPHGMDILKPAGGLMLSRLNQNCGQCHREQTRPFVFEHEALREGCTVCHQPHGSANAKMLTDPDQNLCLKCHAQTQAPGSSGTIYIGKIPHTGFLTQGTCWAAGCHSSIHGSNVDPRMRF